MNISENKENRIQNEFTSYLIQALKRRRYDYIKEQHRKNQYELLYDNWPKIEGLQLTQINITMNLPVAARLEDEITDPHLFELLHKLTHLEYTVLTLAMCYDLRNREISKLLHKSRSAISHARNRALNKLRKGLLLQC